jgi:predicted anti-sigma-YlaC factor YlaD
MTCADLRSLFSQYMDAELPAGSCEQIEKHASECARCSDFLDSVKRTVTLCRDLKAGESPRPLSPDARARLRELYERSLAGRSRK